MWVGRVDPYVMSGNYRGAMAYMSGAIEGIAEDDRVDEATMNRVKSAFNKSLDKYEIDSEVMELE